MLTTADSMTVYLSCGATDMRKSIDGLAAIVKYSFDLDVFTNSLFVFCNKGAQQAQDPLLGPQRLLALLPAPG